MSSHSWHIGSDFCTWISSYFTHISAWSMHLNGSSIGPSRFKRDTPNPSYHHTFDWTMVSTPGKACWKCSLTFWHRFMWGWAFDETMGQSWWIVQLQQSPLRKQWANLYHRSILQWNKKLGGSWTFCWCPMGLKELFLIGCLHQTQARISIRVLQVSDSKLHRGLIRTLEAALMTTGNWTLSCSCSAGVSQRSTQKRHCHTVK